jgi:hypothetical protein
MLVTIRFDASGRIVGIASIGKSGKLTPKQEACIDAKLRAAKVPSVSPGRAGSVGLSLR